MSASTVPTRREGDIFDSFHAPPHGDAEDHAISLVGHMQRRGVAAKVIPIRVDGRDLMVMIRLPSGAVVALDSAHQMLRQLEQRKGLT